jgi:hypothetical protein
MSLISRALAATLLVCATASADDTRTEPVYWTHWTQSLIAGTVAPHAALRSDIHQRGP